MKNELEALKTLALKTLIEYPGSGDATAAQGYLAALEILRGGASHDVIEAMLLDHHKLLERGYRAALSEWEAQNDKERVEG